MPQEPEIKMMSYKARTRFFKVLFLIFIIVLPLFIFYTTGYRISFEEEGTTVVTTGGMYVTTENLEVDVYLDSEQVERPRLFRSAYYIQNISAGQHRVVVQHPLLQTWVKELPVDPYLVVEAAAFNMPAVPHIRPITEYTDSSNRSVFYATSTIEAILENATSTGEFVIVSRRATSTLNQNSEYEFVDELFGTSTATSTSLLARIETEVERFGFATTTASTTAQEIFIEKGDMRIIEREDELIAVWVGNVNNIPHYFCVTDMASTSISERYGEHVMQQIEAQRISTTTPLHIEDDRLCRTEIRIDRKWMTVKSYNFLPGANDLVVLHLDDGLYVGEIDDRAWQNTQLIYPGYDFETVVTDDAIYIKENGQYFELLTEIELE